MVTAEIRERRRFERLNVLMAASIEFAGQTRDVRLRSLSEGGALIEGDLLPAIGTRLVFRKGELVIAAGVARAYPRRCGIVFDEKLSPEAVLHHVSPPAKGSSAKPLTGVRPGLGSRPLSPGDRAHAARLGVRL